MQRIVIVQRGPDSCGKTSAIRRFYTLLRDRYPAALTSHKLFNGSEIRVIMEIDGFRIGIESLGDPWKKKARLEPSIALFIREECDVVVCASRTWGGTVDAVSVLQTHGYEILWRDRTREIGEDDQVAANEAEAKWMYQKAHDAMRQILSAR